MNNLKYKSGVLDKENRVIHLTNESEPGAGNKTNLNQNNQDNKKTFVKEIKITTMSIEHFNMNDIFHSSNSCNSITSNYIESENNLTPTSISKSVDYSLNSYPHSAQLENSNTSFNCLNIKDLNTIQNESFINNDTPTFDKKETNSNILPGNCDINIYPENYKVKTRSGRSNPTHHSSCPSNIPQDISYKESDNRNVLSGRNDTRNNNPMLIQKTNYYTYNNYYINK